MMYKTKWLNAIDRKKVVSIILIVAMVLSILTVAAIPVYATPKEEAIADGMAWLADQQDPDDGSWAQSVGRTGLAVLKFETHAINNTIDPLDPDYQYYAQVRNGLDYIFANAHTMVISTQIYGDPDTDGDGIGVYFGSSLTYETGIAMMAIAHSTHPGMVVNVAGSSVNGWKYRHVVEDAVDYLAFGQNDAGTPRGGWGYSHNSGGTDNSNTGYAVLGLGYAQAPPPGGFELTIPHFVKNELDVFIEYIQNKDGPGASPWPIMPDPKGGSGYQDPYGWVNVLKTGNLLYEMYFVGDSISTPRVQAAIEYLVHHWGDANDDPGWRGSPGNPASYQAMYCTMKGLEAFGIHEIDGIDWQANFEEVLIEQQEDDGYWPPCYWGDDILATEWALLTLEKAVPPSLPPTLVEVKEEIIAIEEKLDLWLPEIKKEIVLIEEKLDKKIAKQELKVELARATCDCCEDKAKVGDDNRYFLLTTLAGKRVDPTKVTVYIGDKELEEDKDYTKEKIIDGTHEIEILLKAIPSGKASSLVVEAEYTDKALETTYTGSNILSMCAPPKCKDVKSLTLKYTGAGTVTIKAYEDKKGKKELNVEQVSDNEFKITPIDKEKLGSNTYINIYDKTSGDLIDTQTIHTSCSKPLDVGDKYGDLEVTEVEKIY